MGRLHICLWLWRGWRAVYDRRDINAVVTMLRERGQLSDSARILLLTDQPGDWWAKRTAALGVEEFPLWPDPVPRMAPGRPNCFRRLRLFDATRQRAMGISPDDIVMSMDADSVVSGPIVPLLAPITSRLHNFAAMGGQAARIHGSLFAFRAFSHAHVWNTFHPTLSPIQLAQLKAAGKGGIGSDQAWLSHKVSGEFLWQREHGCYSFARHGLCLSPSYTKEAVYWSFAGTNKPGGEFVRQVRPDLYDLWQDAYGRA